MNYPIQELEEIIKPNLIHYGIGNCSYYLRILRKIKADHPAVILAKALELSLLMDEEGVFEQLSKVDYFSDPDYFRAATMALYNVFDDDEDETEADKSIFQKNNLLQDLHQGLKLFAGNLEVVEHITNLSQQLHCYQLLAEIPSYLEYAKLNPINYDAFGCSRQ